MDPDYPLSCYPSKMLSAVVNGMIHYAEMRPEKQDEAMRIARGAADLLIRTAVPEGRPLEFLPLTYSGKVIMSAGGEETVMMLYPASVGQAMLNLHAAAGNRKYLDYAVKIGEQYLKLQRPDGSWHLILKLSDGQPAENNFCCPTRIMLFLERLSEVTGETSFRTAADRALPLFRDRIESFNWEGQFEDVTAQKIPYQNLSKHIATDIYMYLGKIRPDDPEVRRGAREVQRFSEDQFIVWEQPGWTGSSEAYKERSEESTRCKDWGWLRWHTPCVLEQYRCYVPVDSSSAKMIRYFLFLYDLEKNPLDLAKARALGDSLTRAQCPDGRIPTWLNPERPVERDWINCMFASAEALKLLARYDGVEI
jgi:maltose/maltodextrin transport system substrate-binding protein